MGYRNGLGTAGPGDDPEVCGAAADEAAEDVREGGGSGMMLFG